MCMKDVAIEGILYSPHDCVTVLDALAYYRRIGDNRTVTAISWLAEEYRVGYLTISAICKLVIQGKFR